MVFDFEQRVQNLLDGTGVILNGSNPWDPQICDQRFYRRVMLQGSIGLGESYMDGWWDCDQLDEFMHRVLGANLESKVRANRSEFLLLLASTLMNRQSPSRAFYSLDLGWVETLAFRRSLPVW